MVNSEEKPFKLIIFDFEKINYNLYSLNHLEEKDDYFPTGFCKLISPLTPCSNILKTCYTICYLLRAMRLSNVVILQLCKPAISVNIVKLQSSPKLYKV